MRKNFLGKDKNTFKLISIVLYEGLEIYQNKISEIDRDAFKKSSKSSQSSLSISNEEEKEEEI